MQKRILQGLVIFDFQISTGNSRKKLFFEILSNLQAKIIIFIFLKIYVFNYFDSSLCLLIVF